MPVERRNNALSHDSPQESIRRAGGYVAIQPVTFNAGSTGASANGYRNFTAPRQLITETAHLGYAWEITNISLPITVLVNGGGEVVKRVFKAQLGFKVYVAGRLIYEERTALVTMNNKGLNAFSTFNISSSPPVPFTLEGGEQIEFEVSLLGEVEQEGAAGWVFTLAIASETEEETSHIATIKKSIGYVNYNYV